ncbi:hypothetical protein C8R42DRAFT_639941 [Lentinula raphanica]|nr:hypothetical protein C8R42DRAFT_639941 [Lentinula raphanica]
MLLIINEFASQLSLQMKHPQPLLVLFQFIDREYFVDMTRYSISSSQWKMLLLAMKFLRVFQCPCFRSGQGRSITMSSDHDAPTAPPSPLPVYGKAILRRHDTLFFQLELKENVVMIHGQGQYTTSSEDYIGSSLGGTLEQHEAGTATENGLLEELEFDDDTIVLENFNSTGNIPEGLSQEHVAEQPMILNLKGVPEFLAEAFGGSTNVLS